MKKLETKAADTKKPEVEVTKPKSADQLNSMLEKLKNERRPILVGQGSPQNLQPFSDARPALVPAGDALQVCKIEVSKLRDSPFQNRKSATEIDKLGRSMVDDGQLVPIRVRPLPDGLYELIAGHRRRDAAVAFGIETLDAMVVNVDDRKACIEVIMTNEGSEELGDYERAIGYLNLKKQGMSQRAIAKHIGVAESLISMRLKFLELPKVCLDELEKYPKAYNFHIIGKLLEMFKQKPSLANDAAELTKNLASEVDPWSVATFLSVLTKRLGRDGELREPSPKFPITGNDNRSLMTIQAKPKGKVEIQLSASVDQSAFMRHLSDVLQKMAEAESNSLVSKAAGG